MSVEWIKMTKELPEKPEVWQIADELEVDPDAVVGKLFRVWSWFDDNTKDGYAPSVTKKIIDRITSVPGFAEAMKKAGWLVEEGDQISAPNFNRHNGETAKSRALSQIRMQRHRYGDSATKASPEKKRKEERKSTKRKFTPPSLDDVKQYAKERNSPVDPARFHEYFETNDWHDAKGNKVKSWKQKFITWESHAQKKDKPDAEVIL